MTSQNKRQSYKVVLLGNGGVGKTSIRRRYMGKGFEANYIVTLGADFAIKRLPDNKILQIWDLAGQLVYKSVRSGYYKGAEGAILVYDITRKDTYNDIPKWIDELLVVSNQTVPLILVGNKADLRVDGDTDQVSTLEGERYAQKLSEWSGYRVPYIESSALTGQNIDQIFENLIEEIEILKNMQEGN